MYQEVTFMEVVRKIMDSELIESVIALPDSFRNTKVEVLVQKINDYDEDTKPGKSIFGALSKYANPSLIAQEENFIKTL